MAKKRKTINLLPKSDLEKSPVGKFLKWALTFGRYIVIFTELVVIIGFLSRFQVDQNLAKVREEIKEKQTIVASFEELEQNTRSLQNRLKYIKKIEAQNTKYSDVLENLSKITPIDIIYQDLVLKQDSLTIKGISLSNVGLSTFLYGLRENKYFSQINLVSVSSKGVKDPTLKFELTTNLTTTTNKKK